MSHELSALSERWNRVGRLHAKRVNEKLDAFHAGKVDEPSLPSDPRDEQLACEVLSAVVELNRSGRWKEARTLFDPAHEPFIFQMGNDGLPFVVALGADSALVRRGSTYEKGHMWLVHGEELSPLPQYIAAAISPDRSALALASRDEIRVVRGWGGDELSRFRWPNTSELVPHWVPESRRDLYTVEIPAESLEAISVANSGTRIAIATRSGVLVATAGQEDWRLVLPRHDEPGEWELEQLAEGEDVGFHGDMVHVALSPDGRLLACGAQDDGHFLFSLDAVGNGELWAKLGHASEYPHNACFSGDGAYVALNSCHFYNGATVLARVAEVSGLTTEPYDGDPRTPLINQYLRVYASTWLPAGALRGASGVFALAGSGCLTLVGVDGKVQSEWMFGSSASAIDYCPKSETLVLGSYSGFLHFLRPAETDPSAVGWRVPREMKRWCFLKDLPPLQW